MKKQLPFSLVPQIVCAFLIFLHAACTESSGKASSDPAPSETGTEAALSDSVFNLLLTTTGNVIPVDVQTDSLGFLLLPINVACPYCREKTIDSIISYSNHMPDNRYIIISVKGGRKLISSYFRERKSELPDLPGVLFLDTANLGLKYELFREEPTIYYTSNRQAYEKVVGLPATIKDDLHLFFSGN